MIKYTFIKAAIIKLTQLIALQYMVSFYEIPSACLRSMGRSLMLALLTIVGCVAFRVLWLVTVFRMYPNNFEKNKLWKFYR